MSTHLQRLVALVNPRGGGGRAAGVLAGVRERILASGLELDVRSTRHARHALEIARDEPFSKSDALIIVGGDGTIHEVVNGLMARSDDTRPPIGILPGGTGNSLARDLALVEPSRAAERIVAAQTCGLDLVRVRLDEQVVYSFNIVGWGIPASAGVRAEKMRWLGPHRYMLATFLEVLRKHSEGVDLSIDGRAVSGELSLVMACNTQHTGTGMRVAPGARFNDGLIDVITLAPTTRLDMLRILREVAKGRHVEHGAFRYRQAAKLAFRLRESAALNIDGEILKAECVEVDVLHDALQLLA